MHDNDTSVSISIQNAMSFLLSKGIHSIFVNSKEEAKNFIMYHVDIGTRVKICNCIEISKLSLDKAIIEKGGTIINNEYIYSLDKKTENRKLTVSELYLYGMEYLFMDHHMNAKSFKDNYSLENNMGKKTIIIIDTNVNYDNSNDNYKNLFQNIKFIEEITNYKNVQGLPLDIDKNITRQKSMNCDISFVFIG